MILYLAGPMRGYPDDNYPAFADARESLRNQGHEVFCPAEETEDLTRIRGERPELRELIGIDLHWICSRADGVVVLPGSEKSLGVTAEVATAMAIGIPAWEYELFLAGGKNAVQILHLPWKSI